MRKQCGSSSLLSTINKKYSWLDYLKNKKSLLCATNYFVLCLIDWMPFWRKSRRGCYHQRQPHAWWDTYFASFRKAHNGLQINFVLYALWGKMPDLKKQKIENMSIFLASWMYCTMDILWKWFLKNRQFLILISKLPGICVNVRKVEKNEFRWGPPEKTEIL